jgi:hypothetical protein
VPPTALFSALRSQVPGCENYSLVCMLSSLIHVQYRRKRGCVLMQAGEIMDITLLRNPQLHRPPNTTTMVLKIQFEDAAVAISAFLLFYCSIHLQSNKFTHPLLVDFWMPRFCEPGDWMIPPEHLHDVKVCLFSVLIRRLRFLLPSQGLTAAILKASVRSYAF